MKIKKNIIFFLANFNRGGAGFSVTNMCQYINKQKYNVYVISLLNNPYKRELKKYCKKIFIIDRDKVIFSLNYIVKNILSKFNKKNTIFISNINYTNVLSVFFLKIIYSYKLVLIERTPLQELNYIYNIKDYIKKKIIKILMILLYKKADLVIANAQKIANDLKKLSSTKSEFIYPFTLKKLSKNIKNKAYKKKFNILSIGRFSVEKNLKEIIRAVGILNDKHICLKLLGNGTEIDNLKSIARSQNVDIKFYKFSNKKEKKLLKETNLYINSSHFEGFPNIILKALDLNVPVIASKSHGGIYEILLNGKGGMLYNQGDEVDLSKKIIEIKNNYSFHLDKTNLHKKKLTKFLAEKNILKFQKLLDRILD